MEPELNEYIDNALDIGNMASSAIKRNFVATPCPAALATSIAAYRGCYEEERKARIAHHFGVDTEALGYEF